MRDLTDLERQQLSNLHYIGLSDDNDELEVPYTTFEEIKNAILASGLC